MDTLVTVYKMLGVSQMFNNWYFLETSYWEKMGSLNKVT